MDITLFRWKHTLCCDRIVNKDRYGESFDNLSLITSSTLGTTCLPYPFISHSELICISGQAQRKTHVDGVDRRISSLYHGGGRL